MIRDISRCGCNIGCGADAGTVGCQVRTSPVGSYRSLSRRGRRNSLVRYRVARPRRVVVSRSTGSIGSYRSIGRRRRRDRLVGDRVTSPRRVVVGLAAGTVCRAWGCTGIGHGSSLVRHGRSRRDGFVGSRMTGPRRVIMGRTVCRGDHGGGPCRYISGLTGW